MTFCLFLLIIYYSIFYSWSLISSLVPETATVTLTLLFALRINVVLRFQFQQQKPIFGGCQEESLAKVLRFK